MKKKVVILGAGITGLALAWFLKKRRSEDLDLSLLEKTAIPGGWMQTMRKEGFLFERGPHSIRVDKEKPEIFSLLQDLNLEKEILIPHPKSNQQFILIDQKLEPLPKTFKSLLFSRFRTPIFKALWQDLRAKKNPLEDESIASFSLRHFGKEATELLIDPLVSGIFAGNIETLSLSSCFPLWKKAEKDNISILRSFFQSKKNSTPLPSILKNNRLFSFKNGMGTLPLTLADQLKDEIQYNSQIKKITFLNHKIQLIDNQNKEMETDFLFSCLSAKDLSQIVPPALKTSLNHFSEVEVSVIHLGYRKKTLFKEGFGYLIPSREKECILGMIWDSSIFPSQNSTLEETRITLIMRKEKNDLIEIALDGVKRHLGITSTPDCIHTTFAKIPQYSLFHQERLLKLNQLAFSFSPNWKILGNAFQGISINDCLVNAKKIADQFLSLH